MSGLQVENKTSEPYIASIDKEKGEAKVLIGYRNAKVINMNFENLPFEGDIKVDRYEITKSVQRINIKDRQNDMDENAGIQYKDTLDSTNFTADFEADRVYMFVIKTEKSVPSDFYLKTPDDNAAVMQQPTFTWQRSEGAQSYTFKVAADKGMKDIVFEKSGITGEEYKIEKELDKDKMYYWTVVAQNENGDREPLNNMYYSFMVQDHEDVPGSFTLLQVVNGAEDMSLTPKFLWSKSRNAKKYVLEVSTKADFSIIDIQKEVTTPEEGAIVDTCGIILEETLKPGTEYYARLWAVNENGTRKMNGEPHIFKTTTADGVPVDFALTYPVDEGTMEQREALRWEKAPGARFYELEIASDADFENVVVKKDTITQPAYTPDSDELEPGQTYYWRVAATDKENDIAKRVRTESSSGICKFTMSKTPAAPLVKVSDPAGAGSVVIWKPVLGADSYTVKTGNRSGEYTEEITGIVGDRAYVPMAEEGYCTVVAVKDEVESDVWNEIKLEASDNAEMTLDVPYQAEAANKLKNAVVGIDKSSVFVTFLKNGDTAEYHNAAGCQELAVTYQADEDTEMAVYEDDKRLGVIELNQTSGKWDRSVLQAEIADGSTLKFVKEGNGAVFKIDSFIPSSGAVLENIAKDSVVTADSETPVFGMKTNVVDKDRQTFWRADTKATVEKPNWLNINLGQKSDIYSVEVQLPTDGWGPREQEIQVLVSEDGTNYKEIAAKKTYEFDNTKNNNQIRIPLSEHVTAQHVKLQFYSNTGDDNNSQAGEILIMGIAAGSSEEEISGKNLALKKPISANEISYGEPQDIADGDKATFSDFGSKNFPNEVIVDLEAIYSLERFEMYLPKNWGTRTQEIEFRSSLDGKNYETLVEKASYKFEQETNHVIVELPESSAGRYIKMIGTANNEAGKPGMQFSEFEVYGNYGERVEGIQINYEKAEVKTFTSLQLEAVLTPENVTNKLVAWSSSNHDVAKVDEDGLVTAIAPGNTVIRVRSIDGDFKKTCSVTVEKNNIVSVANPEPLEIPQGTELKEEELPKSLEVMLEQNVMASLGVGWDISAYKPDEAGTYVLKGTLAEAELIANKNNVQPELTVIVLPVTKEYQVTVNHGLGSGQYEENAVVRIKANEPQEGMQFSKWTSEDIELAEPDNAETTFVMPKKNVTITAEFEKIQPEKKVEDIFDDIDASSWYKEYVQYVFDKNIMKGMTKTEFGPDVILTRSHFATMLYRMEGEPEAEYRNEFHDVQKGEFYTDPVMWASMDGIGIISGYEDGNFGPDDDITREQIAVMLYRYAKYKKYDTSDTEDLSRFEDHEKVSKFAVEAMQWAVGTEMIMGEGDDKQLNPQGGTSRAVCAAMIQRFIDNAAK